MLKIISLFFVLYTAPVFGLECSEYLQMQKAKSCLKTSFFSFSNKRCNHYQAQRKKTEDKQLHVFIDNVLQCLIQETKSSSCEDLWKKNIADHTLCFKRHGYCQMSLLQEWELFVLTGFPADQAAHYFKIFWKTLMLC
jgi:hypothetical protein